MITFIRAVLSIAAMYVFAWLNYFANAAGTLVSGNAAVHQFDNSNTSYLISTPLTQFAGHFALSGFILLAVLVLIWWGPIKRLFAATPGGGTGGLAAAIAFALMVLGSPHPAQAYYDKYDYAEALYVLPNQTAFFIPDVGANKDSQVKLNSMEYYAASQVASKRVLIPHAKLENSGAWSDYYVPTARVILVNRTPYNKEWVSATDRGTSARNEGIPCQDNGGLNITVGINIGVSVPEDGAAKFLYYFGTVPPKGNPKDPNVIFTSIYYARSVEDVMDSYGHGEVASLVCDQINAGSLLQDDQNAGKIIANVRAAATKYFAERGIRVDFLGYADTFSFDAAVQKAINDKFVADTVVPVLPTLQALADVKVKEGLGKGIGDHGLPSNLVAIPESVLGNISNMFKPSGK